MQHRSHHDEPWLDVEVCVRFFVQCSKQIHTTKAKRTVTCDAPNAHFTSTSRALVGSVCMAACASCSLHTIHHEWRPLHYTTALRSFCCWVAVHKMSTASATMSSCGLSPAGPHIWLTHGPAKKPTMTQAPLVPRSPSVRSSHSDTLYHQVPRRRCWPPPGFKSQHHLLHPPRGDL